MSEDRISVLIYLPDSLEPTLAGCHIRDHGQGENIFFYFKEYLVNPAAISIDPVNFPLSQGPKIKACTKGNRWLIGVFQDSTQDFWGQILMARCFGGSIENPLPEDLLRRGGSQRTGNLDFHKPDSHHQIEPLGLPRIGDLEDLIQTARSIENHETRIPRPNSMLKLQRTSLGGARPKTLIEDERGMWLAKLPSQTDTGFWNNARMEMAIMSLAGKCGIEIPEMDIVPTNEGDVLLLKRFDRIKTERGFSRMGFLSCLSVLEGLKDRKHAYSYLDFADSLRIHFPNDWSASEGAKLFRRMVFNILVRNTDDHAKNHGILYNGKRMSLSPAYDIVPDFCLKEQSGTFNQSMAVGPNGKRATWDNVLAGAPHFGLTREGAAHIIREMAGTTADWREHLISHGVTEREMSFVEGSLDSNLHQEAKNLGAERKTEERQTGPQKWKK